MSVESYIKKSVKSIGEKVFVIPEIPEKKLNNAIAVIAPQVEKKYILAIFDSTLFGNGKEGFLFTGDTIYIKPPFQDRVKYKFEDIKKAEYKLIENIKDNGKSEKHEHIYFHFNNETVVEISQSVFIGLHYKVFVDFINNIIKEGGDTGVYIKTAQLLPLSSMDNKIKELYIKIIADFVYAIDNTIESKYYAEIMALMVRVDIAKESRIRIRAYLNDINNSEEVYKLWTELLETTPEGSLDVIKRSLIKDILYIYKIKNDIDTWRNNDFIVNIKKLLEIEDSHIEVIIKAIISDENILLDE